VPTVIYPNAFHSIAELSTRHDPANRRIVKADFLARLHAIKKTTISRWTLALQTAKQILRARRQQLKQNLARNVRRRSFLISETAASDLKKEIVVFMSDYLAKYHFKATHTEPPLFCLDCCESVFDNIRERESTRRASNLPTVLSGHALTAPTLRASLSFRPAGVSRKESSSFAF